MISDFVFDMSLAGMADTTIREYRRRLERLPFELPGSVSEVKHWLAGRPSAADAIYELRVVRAYARWLDAETGADVSGLLAIRSPKAPAYRPGRVARDEEIARAIKWLESNRNWRDLAMVELFRWTGCRRSEAARLLVADVDLAGLQLRFRATKNGDDRVVPVHPALGRALRRYLRYRPDRGHAELFLSRYGKRLSPNAISRQLGKVFTAAGAPDLSSHQLRRRLAHVWAEAGGNDDELMVLCGWRTAEMPAGYRAEFTAERATLSYRRIFR